MLEKIKKNSFYPLILPMLLSCEVNTPKKDAQSYCDCLKEYVDNGKGREKCTLIMKEIIEKYEYSPEQTEELRGELVKCISDVD
ncbi:MAG: hypothetical protein KJ941_12180 [Bacteroidetes bacterium]|nr:hypothetical protein [Bacteroidota bacterium]